MGSKYSVNTLKKGPTHVQGELLSVTAGDCVTQLRLVCNLKLMFIFYHFHLIFLDLGWMQISKTTKSGTLDRGTTVDKVTVAGSSPSTRVLKTMFKRPQLFPKLE